MVIKSWETNEALEELATAQRNSEVVEGVIRGIRKMKLPKRVDGVMKSVEEETLLVTLQGGITGYCPVSEFRERKFNSYNQFITHVEVFKITQINLENQVAMLSAVAANREINKDFWNTLETLKENDALHSKIFEGVVTGRNPDTGRIYVRVDGQDTYMYPEEWAWGRRVIVDAQQGEVIQVKVLLFDKSRGLVRVSRKQAMQDPYDYLKMLNVGDVIAGRITEVHPIRGIYIEVEDGVEIKGSKVRVLAAPEIGDFVTCRVTEIGLEERSGRGLILNYPRGKRKKVDPGSFLFR